MISILCVLISFGKRLFALGENGFSFGESQLGFRGKTNFAWAILISQMVISLGKSSFVLGEKGFRFGRVRIFGWAKGGFDFANDNSY